MNEWMNGKTWIFNKKFTILYVLYKIELLYCEHTEFTFLFAHRIPIHEKYYFRPDNFAPRVFLVVAFLSINGKVGITNTIEI